MPRLALCLAVLLTLVAPAAAQQQVLTGNLITQGALCVGEDCSAGVSFGFDTLQLRENTVRLRMVDTSQPGSYPSTDWELTANDIFAGGVNRFSVTDLDAGRAPFSIEGGAPANLLYLDQGGLVGIGTSAPLLPLHVLDGNSPALRLEQDGSEGFTPQIWDLVGNEAHLFFRDVSSAGQIPFKILRNAPADTLVMGPDGLGLGTASPVAPLDVVRSDGTARIRVAETNGTPAVRELFRMENNGGSYFTLSNAATGGSWFFTHEQNAPNRFIINSSQNPSRGLFLESGGNLRIGGVLVQNSDRASKTAITAVDPAEVLSKLSRLRLSEWSYASDAAGHRHLGPMAQDFYALFGLGTSETGISTLDTSGVALAAIQALTDRLARQEAKIAALEAELARLSR